MDNQLKENFPYCRCCKAKKTWTDREKYHYDYYCDNCIERVCHDEVCQDGKNCALNLY